MDTNQSKSTKVSLSLFTWTVVLLVSDLPNAIWQTLCGDSTCLAFLGKNWFAADHYLDQPGMETDPDRASLFHPAARADAGTMGYELADGDDCLPRVAEPGWLGSCHGRFPVLKAGGYVHYDHGFITDGKATEGVFPHQGGA